jgi:hypothetical protein
MKNPQITHDRREPTRLQTERQRSEKDGRRDRTSTVAPPIQAPAVSEQFDIAFRAWREHLVSFDATPLVEVHAWLERTRAFWTARLDALEAVLREDADRTSKKGSKR